MDVAVAEMEIIVRAGVSREPIFAVNLLPVSYKSGHQVLVAFLAYVRHGLAAGLDDLKVLIVNPDASLKIPFILLEVLRSHIEHVSADLIDLLSAHIEDVVLRQVFCSHHKWHFVTNVLKILSAHGDSSQGRLRRERNVLNAISFIVVGDVRGLSKFAVDGVALKGLDRNILRVRVVIARLLKDGFFGCKLLNNVCGAYALGRVGIQPAVAFLTVSLGDQRSRQ